MTNPVPSPEKKALAEYLSGDSITLYHGTQPSHALQLISQGKHKKAPMGANGGQSSLLYVTTHPENALWFASQSGSSEILEVKVPLNQLRTDPEDGVYDTVLEELQAAVRTGIPASLAVHGDLPAHCFKPMVEHRPQMESTPLMSFLHHRFADRRVPDGSLQKDNFMDWFGRSACVDARGLPMVCFHGTSTWEREGRSLGNFDEFDRLASVKQVRRPVSLDTVGSWFSSNPGEKGAEMYSSKQGVLYPVFLKILDPWVTTFDAMTRKARSLAHLAENEFVGSKGVEALRDWLQETGRDGICLKHDEKRASESTEFQNQTAWIVLEPNQIKSAIGNFGTYDPNDPSISDMKARKNQEVLEMARSRSIQALEFISSIEIGKSHKITQII